MKPVPKSADILNKCHAETVFVASKVAWHQRIKMIDNIGFDQLNIEKEFTFYFYVILIIRHVTISPYLLLQI